LQKHSVLLLKTLIPEKSLKPVSNAVKPTVNRFFLNLLNLVEARNLRVNEDSLKTFFVYLEKCSALFDALKGIALLPLALFLVILSEL
jgi:hypothetical protein